MQRELTSECLWSLRLASLDCELHSVQHRFEIGTEDVLARLIGSKIELIKSKSGLQVDDPSFNQRVIILTSSLPT